MKAVVVLILTLFSMESSLAFSSSSSIPYQPAPGQRCAGRNFQGRRCCTPEHPCGEGEGDCDGPGDGGAHDGNAGCLPGLVCGSNNCKKFGHYYHEKDDCCERPVSSLVSGPYQSSWGSWSSFSRCTSHCSDEPGTKTRTRRCQGSGCRGSLQSQERVCFGTQRCSFHGSSSTTSWGWGSSGRYRNWRGKRETEEDQE